jgi:multidrug efflux pump subunit AcrB
MRPLLIKLLRPFVHVVHWAIVTALMLSGLTCVLLCPILAAVWIYSYNTGTTVRDAEHVFEVNSHGHYTYISRSHRIVMDVMELMLFWAMVVAVPSALANFAFEHLFPPMIWEYEPSGLEPAFTRDMKRPDDRS